MQIIQAAHTPPREAVMRYTYLMRGGNETRRGPGAGQAGDAAEGPGALLWRELAPEDHRTRRHTQICTEAERGTYTQWQQFLAFVILSHIVH